MNIELGVMAIEAAGFHGPQVRGAENVGGEYYYEMFGRLRVYPRLPFYTDR